MTGVGAFRSDGAGVDPWAEMIYKVELGLKAPRLAVQGYLGSLTRPIDITLKQYKWDEPTADISHIQIVLEQRRQWWLRHLQDFPCRDVYPEWWVARYCRRRIWMGHKLSKGDVIRHLRSVEEALENHPNYEIGLLGGEELYFNFLVLGSHVLVEGGYEVAREPSHREVSGLVIDDMNTVNSFKREFDRIWASPQCNHDRNSVLDWFRDQRSALESTVIPAAS